jgi:DNA-binding transcriptional regulator GbsR (MarR family)
MRTSPAMQRFIGHFGALGPRWGIEADTCRAHALLYLAGAPTSPPSTARRSACRRER